MIYQSTPDFSFLKGNPALISTNVTLDINARHRMNFFVRDAAKRSQLMPEKKVIKQFGSFIALLWEEAYKYQLTNAEGYGYSSGLLYRSVKAGIKNVSFETVTRSGDKGYKRFLDYEIKISSDKHGESLNTGRGIGKKKVPVISLIQWIREKESNGTWNGESLSTFKEVLSMAFRIQTSIQLKGNSKPLEMKGWNETDPPNDDVTKRFNELYSKKKASQTKKISLSIEKLLLKRYGSKR